MDGADRHGGTVRLFFCARELLDGPYFPTRLVVREIYWRVVCGVAWAHPSFHRRGIATMDVKTPARDCQRPRPASQIRAPADYTRRSHMAFRYPDSGQLAMTG